MIRLGSNSDLTFNIDIQDAQNMPVRVEDCDEVEITLFTTCDTNLNGEVTSITASYKDGVAKNIVISKNADQVSFDKADVSKLPLGVVRYKYYIKIKSAQSPDKFYDETKVGTTNVVLV